MALPSSIDPNNFPGAYWQEVWAEVDLHQALRDGDVDRILALSGHDMPEDTEPIHVPVPRAMSQVGASILHKNPPTITHPDQAAMEEFVKECLFNAKMRQAADTALTHGSVALRWAPRQRPRKGRTSPVIRMYGRRRFFDTWGDDGELESLVIYTPFHDGNTVYRLFEMHSPGLVEWELYRGGKKLGDKVGLNSYAPVAKMNLPEEGRWKTGIDDLIVRVLPAFPTVDAPQGESHFKGAESLLLALDEEATGNQETSRGARPIMQIPERYKPRNGKWKRKNTVVWVDDEMQDPMNPPTTISVAQGEFSAANANERENQYIDLVLTTRGWAPASFGRGIDGQDISGTSMRYRMALSLDTGEGLAEFWQAIEAEFLSIGAVLDRDDTPDRGWSKPEELPTVELNITISADPKEDAEVISTLASAEAIDALERVRRANPHLDEKEQRAMAQRIEKEGSPTLDPNLQANPFHEEQEEEE